MERVTAIIMAGGFSRRMKTDKTQLPIDGKPLITHVLNQLRPHFQQILVSARDIDSYNFEGVEVVPDEIPNMGPLMGIVSSLKVSKNELNFVQACDIPQTNIALVEKMLNSADGYDAVAPKTKEGNIEPLFAIYNKSVLKTMKNMLAHNRKAVHKVFGLCNAKLIELEKSESIVNLNTMSQYEAFLEKSR